MRGDGDVLVALTSRQPTDPPTLEPMHPIVHLPGSRCDLRTPCSTTSTAVPTEPGATVHNDATEAAALRACHSMVLPPGASPATVAVAPLVPAAV
jgi:hypothetical protein